MQMLRTDLGIKKMFSLAQHILNLKMKEEEEEREMF